MSEKNIQNAKIYERMLQWKQESDGQTALFDKKVHVESENQPLLRSSPVESMTPISTSIFQ